MSAITTITNKFQSRNQRNEGYKEKHGKAVHNLMAQMAHNGWEIPPQAEEVLPLWTTCLYGQKEMKMHKAQTWATEEPIILPDNNIIYNGRLDWYGLFDGIPSIVDYKTECIKDQKTKKQIIADWGLQLNCYFWGMRDKGNPVDRIYILWLPLGDRPVIMQFRVFSKESILQEMKKREIRLIEEY